MQMLHSSNSKLIIVQSQHMPHIQCNETMNTAAQTLQLKKE